MEGKVKKIWDESKRVIRDCAIDNGAIVAANSTKEYYSSEAKHYFYVWPRDAAFTCVAAKVAGIIDIQEKFFSWIQDRAEDIDEDGKLHHHYTGLLYEKYYVNGLQALHRYQPDQGGALMWAIGEYYDYDPEKACKYHNLITGLADGTCKRWDDDHFDIVTNDLWEERHTFPDLKDNFSFALAACSAGLSAVNRMFPNVRYAEVADQMKNLLIASAEGKGYFYRSFGILDDDRTDASLLGISWPFNMVDVDHPHFIHTVDMIMEKILVNDGLYRYEHDEYDGWMYRGYHRKKGVGYWPLLNFWLVTILHKMGRKKEAEHLFQKTMDDIGEDGLIAEQVFNNNIQKAVSPLCWSHNMFIFAAQELGVNF